MTKLKKELGCGGSANKLGVRGECGDHNRRTGANMSGLHANGSAEATGYREAESTPTRSRVALPVYPCSHMATKSSERPRRGAWTSGE
jgi:hypothetical protein